MAKSQNRNASDKLEETVTKPLSSLRFAYSSSDTMDSDTTTNNSNNGLTSPLVSFQAKPKGPKCPFGNPLVKLELYAGGCIWLSGNSGLGKTTLSTCLAGLSSPQDLEKLDIDCPQCDWNPKIPPIERCGVLFQQTTLLDALTVAGNVSVALQSCPSTANRYTTPADRIRKIKQIMEAVGLDYARDAAKRPTELSGGMARRASLALQLAQRKRVIVLDEPFSGLDLETAKSVAKELVQVRRNIGSALILISHEPELAQLVLNEDKDSKQQQLTATVKLTPPTTPPTAPTSSSSSRNLLFGISFWDRFLEKLIDYVFYSLPLIALTFVACGLAISMLSADILQRIDVTDRVLEIVDKELRPMIAMVTGEEEANPMYMMVAKMKVRGMLNTTIPAAKATLYAIGMAKLFVLEIGPLLTALLLCGRIGGSYAGKIATMQATSQTKLLRTLGINPQTWTFLPAMMAALMAAPILTVIGTWISVFLGGIIGPQYGIGTLEGYNEEVWNSVFPKLDLELKLNYEWTVLGFPTFILTMYTASRESIWLSALIELTTYPPVFHIWKSVTFMCILMGVAETIARLQPNLTPRGVPGVITSSVVISSLLIIVADWGFSQWLILRV
ncbi:binding protein MetN [Seminavis robusta]|uniref:Binding protein MetN n=1 Tax=Seminavis robusta TaxID=568900 RepID=A0A9N8HGK4_9STRA|nr:binding protein MetN [Seminavis robusta]|eukprot:Sro489_g153240.1 binding protein MetN (615) ;mRNA; r:14983-16827